MKLDIELTRTLTPEEMKEKECGLCGHPFTIDVVVGTLMARDYGPFGGDHYVGEVCPECVEYLGRRSPERYPTIEEYREGARLFPETVFVSREECDRLFQYENDAWREGIGVSDLDREDLRPEPSEEGIHELIRKTDAFTDCKTVLIDAVKAVGGPPERWNNIRKHVFPVLRRESARLEKEVDSYKEALEA